VQETELEDRKLLRYIEVKTNKETLNFKRVFVCKLLCKLN